MLLLSKTLSRCWASSSRYGCSTKRARWRHCRTHCVTRRTRWTQRHAYCYFLPGTACATHRPGALFTAPTRQGRTLLSPLALTLNVFFYLRIFSLDTKPGFWTVATLVVRACLPRGEGAVTKILGRRACRLYLLDAPGRRFLNLVLPRPRFPHFLRPSRPLTKRPALPRRRAPPTRACRGSLSRTPTSRSCNPYACHNSPAKILNQRESSLLFLLES